MNEQDDQQEEVPDKHIVSLRHDLEELQDYTVGKLFMLNLNPLMMASASLGMSIGFMFVFLIYKIERIK